MSTHLTNREIDNFVSGLASHKDAKAAEEHLKLCPQCRMIVDSLSNIVAKQPSGDVPGEHIRDNIIAEWYKLHNKYAEKKFSARLKMKRLVAGLAVAASVVIAVSSYLFFNNVNNNGYSLVVSTVSGDCFNNELKTAVNDNIKPGDVLTTKSNSSIVISSVDYNLFISELSSIRVTGNSKKDGIIFSLNTGSVISKSSGTIRYSFECGEYKIVPVGTEFMIQLSKGELSVAVSQGKVVVTGPDVHVEIPAGMKWSSLNRGGVEAMDEKDTVLINTLKSESRPGKTSFSSESEVKPAVKDSQTGTSGSEKIKSISDPGNGKSNSTVDRKEKIDNIKLNRELRDEIKEVKKEQRKEKRREKTGRNKG